ncbi:odorant receptor 85a-like [Culicoides brevitarsis]|uniref:odorant receptor 85a-like n=1 Tax=Culicoides brevitarsis TaxID=469753 RepID=UPI00307CAA61
MVSLNIKSRVKFFLFFLEISTVTSKNKLLKLIALILASSYISFYFTFSMTSIPELLAAEGFRKIEILYEVLPGISVGVKLLLLFPYRKRIKPLLNAFDEIDFTEEGKEVMLKYFTKFKKILKILTCLWGFAASGGILASIVLQKIPIENQRIPGVEATEGVVDWKFIVTVIQQDTYILYALSAFIFLDGYPSLILALISGYLEGVVLKVQKIGWAEKESNQESKSKLIECLKMHQKAYELQTEFSTIFSKALLAQCAMTTFIICSLMVKLSLESPLNNLQLFIRNITIIISVLYQVASFNYMGSQLISSNEMLKNAIFEMNWVDKDLKFKKLMLMFQQRTEKLIQIRIGYIIVVDMRIVTEICNLAYKLYAVMMKINR